MTTRHVLAALLIVLGAGCGGGGDENSARNTSGVVDDATCAYEWLRATWNCPDGGGLVEGVVDDEQGEPLRNAHIEFWRGSATTHENGAFSVCLTIRDYDYGLLVYLRNGEGSGHSEEYPSDLPGVCQSEVRSPAFSVTKCSPAQVHYRLTHRATADGRYMFMHEVWPGIAGS